LVQAQSVSTKLADNAEPQRRSILAAMFHKIRLGTGAITFDVNTAALVQLTLTDTALAPPIFDDGARPDAMVSITLPLEIKRRGNEMRMVIEGEQSSNCPDPALVNLVARAHLYLARITAQPAMSISDIAAQLGVHRADVGRVLPLAFLSPRLLEQILSGRQPADLTARRLTRLDLPLEWSDQVRALA
jgi:hypothetical protein